MPNNFDTTDIEHYYTHAIHEYIDPDAILNGCFVCSLVLNIYLMRVNLHFG